MYAEIAFSVIKCSFYVPTVKNWKPTPEHSSNFHWSLKKKNSSHFYLIIQILKSLLWSWKKHIYFTLYYICTTSPCACSTSDNKNKTAMKNSSEKFGVTILVMHRTPKALQIRARNINRVSRWRDWKTRSSQEIKNDSFLSSEYFLHAKCMMSVYVIKSICETQKSINNPKHSDYFGWMIILCFLKIMKYPRQQLVI